MGRHPDRRRAGRGQRAAARMVQALTNRQGKVAVDRLPHEVVPERQLVTRPTEQAGTHRVVEGAQPSSSRRQRIVEGSGSAQSQSTSMRNPGSTDDGRGPPLRRSVR